MKESYLKMANEKLEELNKTKEIQKKFNERRHLTICITGTDAMYLNKIHLGNEVMEGITTLVKAKIDSKINKLQAEFDALPGGDGGVDSV